MIYPPECKSVELNLLSGSQKDQRNFVMPTYETLKE